MLNIVTGVLVLLLKFEYVYSKKLAMGSIFIKNTAPRGWLGAPPPEPDPAARPPDPAPNHPLGPVFLMKILPMASIFE